MIGHGCQSPSEMRDWCKAKNDELGEEVYHTVEWPVEEEALPVPVTIKAPVVAVETPAVVPIAKPKAAAKPAEKAPVEVSSPSLNKFEEEIFRIALGLHRGKLVCQNVFEAKIEPERVICNRMVERGLMRIKGSNYHLTVAGIAALNKKQTLTFGVLG